MCQTFADIFEPKLQSVIKKDSFSVPGTEGTLLPLKAFKKFKMAIHQLIRYGGVEGGGVDS